MVKIIRSFIFIELFLISLNSWSQDLKFVHYTNEHGLPSSYVKDITQDHLGFIWIATRNAVTRFDGTQFKNYSTKNNQGQTTDIWAMSFHYAGDSSLIIQTTDNNYYSFNFAIEQFEPCEMLNSLEGNVYLNNSSRGFWVSNDNKITYFDTEKQDFLSIEEKLNFGNLGQDVDFLHVRELDKIVVAITSEGNFMVFDLKQKLQRSLAISKEINIYQIANFYLDRNNNAWITEFSNGVFKVNLTNGHTTHFSYAQTGNRHILHNFVHDVCEDEKGRIWIGTEN